MLFSGLNFWLCCHDGTQNSSTFVAEQVHVAWMAAVLNWVMKDSVVLQLCGVLFASQLGKGGMGFRRKSRKLNGSLGEGEKLEVTEFSMRHGSYQAQEMTYA